MRAFFNVPRLADGGESLMGIMSRIPRPKAVNTAMEEMIRRVFGGGDTSSGVSISEDSAMRQATVYSCINILSRVIGMLPCHLMEKVGKDRNVADGHSLYPLLHDMPNEWMTAPMFWGMAVNHLVARGNFFALINRGLNRLTGKVKELIPLSPGVVQDVVQNPDYSLIYKCRFPNGESQEIPGSEIMHLRGMVTNGYMGVSPVSYIRETIGLGIVTEKFGARTFGAGTHPSMIITHPHTLKDPKAVRDALSDVYAGLDNSHRIMLLEDGMTATNVSISGQDSQYLDTRKFQKSEIVDIFFGMPLTIMSNGDKTPTFASAEQFSISFIVYALLPWVYSIEKSIYKDLLSIEQRKRFYAKFKVEGLLRGSFKEQMEGFAIAIDKEIYCPNDVLDKMDENGHKGGEIYKTRTSTTKQDRLTQNNNEEVAP